MQSRPSDGKRIRMRMGVLLPRFPSGSTGSPMLLPRSCRGSTSTAGILAGLRRRRSTRDRERTARFRPARRPVRPRNLQEIESRSGVGLRLRRRPDLPHRLVVGTRNRPSRRGGLSCRSSSLAVSRSAAPPRCSASFRSSVTSRRRHPTRACPGPNSRLVHRAVPRRLRAMIQSTPHQPGRGTASSPRSFEEPFGPDRRLCRMRFEWPKRERTAKHESASCADER